MIEMTKPLAEKTKSGLNHNNKNINIKKKNKIFFSENRHEERQQETHQAYLTQEGKITTSLRQKTGKNYTEGPLVAMKLSNYTTFCFASSHGDALIM